MCRANKTMDWYNRKPPQEKEKLMEQARVAAVDMAKVEKRRAAELESYKVEKMKGKVVDLQEKEKRELLRTENKIDAVKRYGGLWMSQAEMTQQLHKCTSDTQRIKALRAQIGFRRQVLQCKPLMKMNVASANLATLVDYMNILLRLDVPYHTIEIATLLRGDEKDLIHRRFEQVWTDNAEGVGVEKVYRGRIVDTSMSDQGKPELQLEFDGCPGYYYIEHSELVADLTKGNFTSLPETSASESGLPVALPTT